MTREDLDFIGSMNMCDEISNEAYKKIMCHCEEQEPCEDAVSRHMAIDAMYELCDTGETLKENPWRDNPHIDAIIDTIENLPSVTPQPKVGKWIDIMIGDVPAQACDQCNTFYPLAYTGGGHNYCPNCGAKMEVE